MRDDLHQKVMAAASDMRINVLREILQWEVISALHQGEAFNTVAFIGGTSLRLLHGLGRFSEDLDFSTIGADMDRDRLSAWGKVIRKRLERCALSGIEFTIGTGTGAVLSADVRVAGILKEMGISPMESQKLKIKIEIDTNPPEGANLQRLLTSTPDRKMITVGTYDLESLMAGKLHALLARPYTKGRDWYDLLWYCAGKVEPNTALLNSALQQVPSQWCERAEDWKDSVLALAEQTDWKHVAHDVGRFLENGSEIEMLNEDTVKMALQGYGRRRGFSM